MERCQDGLLGLRSAANASGRRSRGWCVEKHEVQPGPVWERRSEPARHGRSSHRVLGPLTAYTASKMRCDAMRCDSQLSCHAISERFWCAHGPPLVFFPFASSPLFHTASASMKMSPDSVPAQGPLPLAVNPAVILRRATGQRRP